MSNFCKNKIKNTGICLKHKHFAEILETKPKIPWLEVHTENFFNLNSNASRYLEKIREVYPISLHSVGMSLGSASGVDYDHLGKIKATIERFEPELISDHLSWNTASDKNSTIHLPDLLPIPYTKEALNILVENIEKTQDFLDREIMIENPSSYLAFKECDYTEWDFLVEAANQSGCKILLDVNNIYVSAFNHNFSAEEYLTHIPTKLVNEMHLAGYCINEIEGEQVYIDDHGAKIYDEVWSLYEKAIEKFGQVPTLVEWDTNVPELSVLLEEAAKADKIIAEVNRRD